MCVFFSSEASHSPVKSFPETSPMTSLRQHRDSDRYCQLCNAWFNNPGMAQQHYDGKKHKKNAARADLLEQLGKTLDVGEMKGTVWRHVGVLITVPLYYTVPSIHHLLYVKHNTELLQRRMLHHTLRSTGWLTGNYFSHYSTVLQVNLLYGWPCCWTGCSDATNR